jgi:2-keto-4-pentenoate hydratase
VKELLAAYDSGIPIPPLRERVIPVGDIAAAYAVQREMTEHWQTQGRRLVGAKIGLTNPAVQEVFGVFQPDFGVLFADMAVPDGDTVELDRLIQPKVEAEVALCWAKICPTRRARRWM